MRRTKIVATIGPATWESEQVKLLIAAGVDVFRVNFAHSSPVDHERMIKMVRAQADAMDTTVGVLADLPGPKMRTGDLAQEEVRLLPGHPFVLTADGAPGDWTRVSTTVSDLTGMVKKDDEIFLADGEIVLRVVDLRAGDVITEVIRGGRLRSRKGMHLPRAERHVEAFTAEDEIALKRAVTLGVDLVGLSFVRDAEDIARARAAVPAMGHRMYFVAKIETRSAIDNLNEIVSAADAVMVARGDLGIQMSYSEVPRLQKRIIAACNAAGKPVITATEMLDTMTHSPLPTRAEATDVANAVMDGTDALMLSEETAVGEFPVETVRAMSEIAGAAEQDTGKGTEPADEHMQDDRVSWAVAGAAVQAAEQLKVGAILCPTRSGATALRVAAFRPSRSIVALSEDARTLGPLNLVWGVTPLQFDAPPKDLTAEADVDRAVRAAYSAGLLSQGQHVAVVAGTPGNRAGRTDYVRIVKVG
ncbi:MAG: pyruvate kinase [Actinomycetota bacterium]